MNKIFVATLVLSSFVSVKALTCWVCENVKNNDDCIRRGRAMRCQWNELACQTSLRRGSFGMLITKRCKQAEACENNFIQNPRAAWEFTQCNSRVSSSVCRCCCDTDLCNRDSLNCGGQRGDRPTCQRIAAPRNGKTFCDPSPDNRERISTVGTICTFQCNSGFVIRGKARSTCLERQNQNVAEFNNPVPQCVPSICLPQRPSPTNGRVDCTNGNNINSVCTYSCDEGYGLVGIRDTTCGNNLQWTQAQTPSCEQVTCLPRHTNPSHGQVTCSNENNYNSVCRFSCNPGYFRNGFEESRCITDGDGDVDGVWTSSAPICVRDTCNPAQSAPENGLISCTDGNNFGSTCRFNCNDGYYLNGIRETSCVDKDGTGIWNSSPAPTCIKVTCSVLKAPENGTVSCSDGSNIRSECSFNCNLGYFLDGSPTTTCEDDVDDDAEGVWTNQSPMCKPIICTPPFSNPSNGEVTCTNFNNFGSVCSFTCNPEFILNGARESSCVDDNNGDAVGEWNEQAPTCSQVTCVPPHGEPGNGTVSCTNSNNLGSVCSFTCNPGFFLNGAEQSRCVDDNDGDADGVWNEQAPICIQITCNPDQNAPGNGSVSCSNGNNLGSTCSFTCNLGFVRNGARESRCIDDNNGDAIGEWNEQAPTCTQITCNPPQRGPGNGTVFCTNGNNLGSVCSFDCDSGFFLNGIPTTFCGDDLDGDNEGFWSTPSPICEPIKCLPPHEPPANGQVTCSDINYLGSICKFSCNPGYLRNGAAQSTCVDDNDNDSDGLWNEQAPTCTQILCSPERVAPGNGSVSCSDGNNEGSICGFDCDSGYFLNGEPTTTCQDDGDGDAQGVWNNPNPSCEPIVCNPPHRSPENGRVQCSDRNNLGSICRFTCNSGFDRNGDLLSICVDDKNGDAIGKWDEPAPTCTQITCDPERSAPGNGSVSCSDGNNEGSRCNYGCDFGYILDGSQETTCEDDLNDDAEGLWSNPPPTCRPIICSPPHRNPTNGRVSCTNSNNLGSICSFTCNNNFAMVGDEASVCNDDNNGDTLGQWSAEAPVCQPITCQPPYTEIGNGTVSCTNDNFVGSQCTFTCINNNFALLGNPISTCLAPADGGATGRWSFPEPACLLKRCGAPPDAPEDGDIVCKDGDFLGSRCEFTCNNYHTRVGSLYTTCVEDTTIDIRFWDNPSPICQPNLCSAQRLSHGRVTCDDLDLVATTNCTFECVDPGYQLFPPNITENRCLNDSNWSIPRPCCTRPCPPYALMDFVIVMDSSSSIGRANWATMKSFVRNIIDSFNVAPNSANIGVFRYNKNVDVRTQILLNSYPNDKAALLQAVEAIPYDGSGTYTGQALEHAKTVLFSPSNGNRSDVRDVMLIITDGKAQDPKVVAEAAKNLQNDGVLIYVLGIKPRRGALDRNELEEIAGNPNNVMIAEQGFQGLDDQLITSISSQICGDPCAEDPRPT